MKKNRNFIFQFENYYRKSRNWNGKKISYIAIEFEWCMDWSGRWNLETGNIRSWTMWVKYNCCCSLFFLEFRYLVEYTRKRKLLLKIVSDHNFELSSEKKTLTTYSLLLISDIYMKIHRVSLSLIFYCYRPMTFFCDD